jgi:hypothetical protein
MTVKNKPSAGSKSPLYWILKKPELPVSLTLIVAFFLPWFSNPVLTAPGYDIGKILGFLSIPQPVFFFLVLMAFLVPLGGIIISVLSILHKSVALICMIIGMFPIVIMVVLYFKTHLILNQMASGIFLVMITAIFLLLIGANK